MDIFILKKSITDLKNPIVRTEYQTSATTVGEFIAEMVRKNYAKKPVKDSVEACIRLAQSEFEDGSYYIVNVTRDVRYETLSQPTEFDDGDEAALIKLKYVRGIIW